LRTPRRSPRPARRAGPLPATAGAPAVAGGFARGWTTPAAAGLIALAAWAAYHDSFGGPLIFDDPPAIVDNPTIRRLWPIWPVLLPPADGSAVDHRPFTNLSLAVNYALGGTQVRGYHAFNLAAHLLAALTLFGVVRRSLRLPAFAERFGAAATPLALFATLIWTVHPLQTNAVTYIIQRTEVLSGLFYLLTLYCVIRGAEGRGDRGQGTGDRPRVSVPCPLSPVPCPPFPVPFLWYTAAVVSCLLALGSKESAVSAPAVVLVYDRLFLARSWREVAKRRWALYLALAATWGLTAASLMRTWALLPPVVRHVVEARRFGPWLDYALLQFQSISMYLRLCFWPSPLVLDYGVGHVERLAQVLPCAVFVLVLVGLTAAALWWRPGLGFLGLWFFAILAPSSGLVPITAEWAAEKRMYLPLAAVVLLVVASTYHWGRRWLAGRPSPRPWAIALGYAVAAATVLALTLAAIGRNRDYRSARAIYQDTVDKRPENARAYCNLGTVLQQQGDLAAAADCFRTAVTLAPKRGDTHNGLGFVLVRQGHAAEAITEFRQAVACDPYDVDARVNLAQALVRQDKPEEALAEYGRALDLDPRAPALQNNLANLLAGRGRWDEAIAHYRAALAISPDYVEARSNLAQAQYRLGCLRQQQGDVEAAMWCYQQAIQSKPDFAEPHSNLAVALAGQGRLDEAIGHWRRALALEPSLVQARFNMGLALEQQGNVREAIDQWREIKGAEAAALVRRAIGLANDPPPELFDTLAAACAEAGRFAEAVQSAQRGLELASRRHDARLAAALAERLKQCQEAKPRSP
jgi:tetratricopeptide (TPR) repeat protein